MRPGGLAVSNDAATVEAAAVVSVPAAEPVVGQAVGPESSLPLKKSSGDKSYLVQEYLPPGAYARFVAGYPGVAALTVLVVLGAFVGIVQIPGYFAILEGDSAFPRQNSPSPESASPNFHPAQRFRSHRGRERKKWQH